MKMAHDLGKAPGRRGQTVLDAFLEDLAGLELPVEPHERSCQMQVPLREVRLEFYHSSSIISSSFPPS